MQSEVTFIIKAFERPKHLNLLIESIKKFYPSIRVIVADDSLNPQVRNDVEYHTLPYDVGVSAGRNYLIDQVKTEYFLCLDDDFIFIEETKVEKMLEIIKKYNLDLVAGDVFQEGASIKYFGQIKKKGSEAYYVYDYEDKGDHYIVDIFPMFFIGRTSSDLKYDPYFKVTEHFDFLYTLKLQGKKCGYLKDVLIKHERKSFPLSEDYEEKRNKRRKSFFKKILEKHSLTKVVSFKETVQ